MRALAVKPKSNGSARTRAVSRLGDPTTIGIMLLRPICGVACTIQAAVRPTMPVPVARPTTRPARGPRRRKFTWRTHPLRSPAAPRSRLSGAAPYVPDTGVWQLHVVLDKFGFDKSRLTPEFWTKLQKLSSFPHILPPSAPDLTAIRHTASAGETYNADLSERRADTVADAIGLRLGGPSHGSATVRTNRWPTTPPSRRARPAG